MQQRLQASRRMSQLMGARTPARSTRKGQYMGVCNLTNCLAPGSEPTWYNRGSHAFYCVHCAKMLNRANANDEFCKDEPLCYAVSNHEEAAELHVSR